MYDSCGNDVVSCCDCHCRWTCDDEVRVQYTRSVERHDRGGSGKDDSWRKLRVTEETHRWAQEALVFRFAVFFSFALLYSGNVIQPSTKHHPQPNNQTNTTNHSHLHTPINRGNPPTSLTAARTRCAHLPHLLPAYPLIYPSNHSFLTMPFNLSQSLSSMWTGSVRCAER